MKHVTTHAYRLGLMVLLISLFGGVSYAMGVIIPAGAVEAPVSHNIGNGLHGEFYKPHRRVDHIDIAEQVVATMKPDSTFHSTLLDYPNGHRNITPSTSRLSDYLGRDRSSIDGNGRTQLTNSVLRFYGLIKITKNMDGNRVSPTIDVRIAAGSDDGCRVRVGGQIIAEWPGLRAFGFVSGVARFIVEGLYKIEVLCFEHAGHTGLEVYTNIRGGPNFGGPHNYAGIVPTHVLSSKKAGIGGKITGLDVTNQPCWNLTTDQIVQVVETDHGHWSCGDDFEWDPWDMIQILTIGTGQ